jgi:hypothetical protein
VADEERAVVYVRAASDASLSAADKAKALEVLADLRTHWGEHGVDCDAVKAAAAALALTNPALQVHDYSGQRQYTDPRFAAAMFGLAKVGDFTATPVSTPWGSDHICLKQITPPKNIPFEGAEKELRERFFDVARIAGFKRFTDKVLAAHDVRVPDAKDRDRMVRRAFDLPAEDASPAAPGARR